MRISKLILGATAAVALVSVASTSALAATADGKCKLTNVDVDKVLYDGECTIHQEETDYGTLFSIKMGNAQSFKFAGKGDSWMHGAEKVHFKDLGGGAIFKWGDFALSAVVE